MGYASKALAAAALVALQFVGIAHAADRPHIQTGEDYVNEVLSAPQLPIDAPREMFAAVFASLGERVKVYPTENYYYFSFIQNGVRYGGNIRFDAKDRDDGKLHFAYFEEFAEWRSPPSVIRIELDKSDGVAVERINSLRYRVGYRNKFVTFELNDLAGVVPPPSAVDRDEKFIGPIFDESAIRFFLVYNAKLKIFHYLLDETVKPADELAPVSNADRILIGKRTGFAFYRDHRLDRKILIGVFDANVYANNYLDGPFDQLPDNFLDGDLLRRSIVDVEPGLAGKIDRFGGFLDGSGRYLIAPYLRFHKVEDLLAVDKCAAARRSARDDYYACFVAQSAAANRQSPRRPGVRRRHAD